jgi:hypothetical protein
MKLSSFFVAAALLAVVFAVASTGAVLPGFSITISEDSAPFLAPTAQIIFSILLFNLSLSLLYKSLD